LDNLGMELLATKFDKIPMMRSFTRVRVLMSGCTNIRGAIGHNR
jgi:hypothetical protein